MQAKSLQYNTYHWNIFLDNYERTKITEKGQKKSSDILLPIAMYNMLNISIAYSYLVFWWDECESFCASDETVKIFYIICMYHWGRTSATKPHKLCENETKNYCKWVAICLRNNYSKATVAVWIMWTNLQPFQIYQSLGWILRHQKRFLETNVFKVMSIVANCYQAPAHC